MQECYLNLLGRYAKKQSVFWVDLVWLRVKLHLLKGYPHDIGQQVQANFFFNRQKTTIEASTIAQAETISIKPRNKIFLNV
jgi:hypothetical protein